MHHIHCLHKQYLALIAEDIMDNKDLVLVRRTQSGVRGEHYSSHTIYSHIPSFFSLFLLGVLKIPYIYLYSNMHFSILLLSLSLA